MNPKLVQPRINRRLKPPNPIFHFKNPKEEESLVPKGLLKAAKRTGKLNLSGKSLVTIPDEVLNLSELHSDDNIVVDLNRPEDDDQSKWWELEPLTLLDLSSNSISTIPKAINKLDALTTLILRDNNLSQLPKELGHLYRLTKLDLSQNNLSSLPIEITSIKDLNWLNVANNKLTEVPDCVYDFVMLQYLDLSYNEIAKMAPGMGFLIRLVTINLSHNKLKTLPLDFSNLKGLNDLNLSYNELTSSGLPPLGDLHNVQIINLVGNQLNHIPSLNGCEQLKELHLSNNQIKEVTIEELSSLSHLQIITLRDNHLEKLPKEMACMQNLIRLDLSNNNLTELPATLGLLPHLHSLQVEGNSLRTIRRDVIQAGTQRLLKYLKQTLPVTEEDRNLIKTLPCTSETTMPDRYSMRSSKAVNLSSKQLCNVADSVFEEAAEVPCSIVDLSKNKLTKVPEKLFLLASTLTDLNLAQNQLKEIPKDIGRCLNMQYLNVESNLLEDLPADLGNCKRLRELLIGFNRFQNLPDCIYELQSLEILSARDNKICKIEVESLMKLKFLTSFEMSNNSIGQVPPQLGNMVQIRYLGLDGNGLKVPRPAILAKGTESVMAWLRDKIPN